MDEWLNYMYMMGVVDDIGTIGNPLLKNLYYEYKRRFPESLLKDDFFFDNTPDEQIRLLYSAIYNNEPIKAYIK